MKVALAQINPIIGDLKYNSEKIVKFAQSAKTRGAEVVVFPEMALCGYPPEDLLILPSFVDAIEKALEELIPKLKGIVAIVGSVRKNPTLREKSLYNTAAIINDGKLEGFQDKTLLPTYDVFDERRYFEPASEIKLWNLAGKKVGITICEDLWQHAEAVFYSVYQKDPVLELKKLAPELCINISSSPYYFGRMLTRSDVCQRAALTLKVPVLLCNQVGGNDSLIFDGYSIFVGKNAEVLSQAKSFEEDLHIVDTDSVKGQVKEVDHVGDLFKALCLGIKDYFGKIGHKKAIFGLSGGIDSAVVAGLAKEALGAENILALALPSRYSSKESMDDALSLAKVLGIKLEVVSIEEPFKAYLSTLEPHFLGKKPDITEENLQARIRGMILMAFSNKFGHFVLNTGNKSELAMGYSTLYGDMCGALSVLGDVSKRQIYELAKWINRDKIVIPQRIIDKAPSAELAPNQKDSDTLPPYEIIDTVLSAYVEDHLSPEEIAKKHTIELSLVKDLVRKIHLNEYKRRQAPPVLRVTKKAFTAGRRFPIVQHWNL